MPVHGLSLLADGTSTVDVVHHPIQPMFPLFQHQYDCQELVIHKSVFLSVADILHGKISTRERLWWIPFHSVPLCVWVFSQRH